MPATAKRKRSVAKRTRRTPRKSTALTRTSQPGISSMLPTVAEECASLRAQIAGQMSRRNVSAGINLSLGDIGEEYQPNLRSIRDRMATFDRMRNDPGIRGQLRAIDMTLISGVRWSVKGGPKWAQELVKANLLRAPKSQRKWWSSSSWINLLYEILGFLDYGFSPFHVSWAPPIDGRVVIADLTWLHPRSWDEDGWDMDEYDNLKGIRRSYTDNTGRHHTRERIDADELFIAVWDKRGPNWEGNAFIRPMYKPWVLGEMAEKIDIIDLQNRGVGIPVAYLSGRGGTKERDTLIEILKSLRGGSKERAFIVLDKDEEVKFLTSTGTTKDATPILDYHRSNKAKAGGTEYFEQGSTSTGSRAGASALATGFFINVDAVRIILEDQINHGSGRMPGLVQMLVDANGEVDEYPRIVGSRVSPTEQLDNIDLIGDMVNKRVIPPVRSVGNEVLEKLGYDPISQKEWDKAMQVQPGAPAGAVGRPDGAGTDPDGRDDKDSNRLKMTSEAEKKTPFGDHQQSRSPASWPWLRSTGTLSQKQTGTRQPSTGGRT